MEDLVIAFFAVMILSVVLDPWQGAPDQAKHLVFWFILSFVVVYVWLADWIDVPWIGE